MKNLFRTSAANATGKQQTATTVFDDDVEQSSGVVRLYSWGTIPSSSSSNTSNPLNSSPLGHKNLASNNNSDTKSTDPKAKTEEIDLNVDTGLVQGKPIVSVACGTTHTMAITNDFQLLGCGDNTECQIQPNAVSPSSLISFPRLTNVKLPNESHAHSIIQVACGRDFTVYLTVIGRVYSYGDNSYGQLGHSYDRETKVVEPRMLEGASHEVFVYVCCGERSTYVLSKHGRVFSCGYGKHGRLGLGYYTPEQIVLKAEGSAVGKDDLSKNGQVGDKGKEKVKTKVIGNDPLFERNSHELREVGGPLKGNPVISLTAGSAHCLAVTVTGKVYGWGLNTSGQLGLSLVNEEKDDEDEFENNNYLSVPTHIPIPGDVPIIECAAGPQHSLFLSSSRREIFATGSNAFGQIGHSKSKIKNILLFDEVFRVSDVNDGFNIFLNEELNNVKILQIGAANNHSVAVFENGQVVVFATPKVLSSMKLDAATNLDEVGKNVFLLKDVSDVFGLACGGHAGSDSTFLLRSNQYKALIEQKMKKLTILKDLFPIGIDAKRIKDINEKSNASKAFDKLLPKLRTVLFDMHALNASFISESSRRSVETVNKHQFKFESSFVDIDGMRESMSLVLKYVTDKNEKLRFRQLISSLVAQLNRSAPYVTEPDQLRAYFLLILSPVMLNFAPREHEILVVSIFKLPKVSRRLIFSWLYNDIVLKPRDNYNSVRLFIEWVVTPMLEHLDKHIKNRKYTTQAVVLCKFLFCLYLMVMNKDEVSSTDFYTKVPATFDFETLRNMYRGWRAVVNKNFGESNRRPVTGGSIIERLLGIRMPMVDDGAENSIRRMQSNTSIGTQTSEVPEQYVVKGSTFGLEEFTPALLQLMDSDMFSKEDSIHDTETDSLLKTSPEFVLFQYPFLLSADTKRRFMQIDDAESQQMNMQEGFFRGGGELLFQMQINRHDMVPDVIQCLTDAMKNPGKLRRPLKVKFKGEEGLDAGGVKKEFFLLLSGLIFSPNFGHFKEISKTHQLWFNNTLEQNCLPDKTNILYHEYIDGISIFEKSHLEEKQLFKIIGCIMGLAVYNDTLLDVQFPTTMYKLMLKQLDEEKLDLEEYAKFDPYSAQQLNYIKKVKTADEMEAMGLTFEITEEYFGAYRTIELCPNGSKTDVTLENRDKYIETYIKYHMYSPLIKCKATELMKGFNLVISSHQAALRLFNPDELELLMCGTKELDFSLLIQNCEYEGGYHANSKSVKRLWKIIQDFDDEKKMLFLKFCTGSSRAPVGGLRNIKFKVQRAGPDSDQLPTSHTCFNTFMLPDYSSEAKMKRLLLLAIENSEGFGLE